MEIASRERFWLDFFFLPKQPSCVFWRPVNHSSSSRKRGEEYMIQPSKNAGRLGVWRKPGISPGWRLPPGHPAKPVPACWARSGTTAQHRQAELGTPCCHVLGSPAERGVEALCHCHYTALFQQVGLLPRFQGQVDSKISTFAQLKRRNSRGFLKSVSGAGRQDPVNLGSSVFPVHQCAWGGCAGHIPLTHC